MIPLYIFIEILQVDILQLDDDKKSRLFIINLGISIPTK